MATTLSRFSSLNSQRPAFTLVEMVVVIAIILIIVGLTVPSVSSMWEERKAAGAEITLSGTLMTARSLAIRHTRQRGLFFMVDGDGVQRIFHIEAEPYDPSNSDDTDAGVAVEDTPNRFRIADDREMTLPSPIRVAPRAIVDDSQNDDFFWSPAEIARNDYAAAHNQFERHRNFFTVIFAEDGQLLVRRDVLIHDADVDTNGDGDRTGLAVKDADAWFDLNGTPAPFPSGAGASLPDMIYETGGQTAINFPSVDGLLVYDDSSFIDQPTAALKRKYLLDAGQPLYLARLTGEVIRGPKGEN